MQIALEDLPASEIPSKSLWDSMGFSTEEDCPISPWHPVSPPLNWDLSRQPAGRLCSHSNLAQSDLLHNPVARTRDDFAQSFHFQNLSEL